MRHNTNHKGKPQDCYLCEAEAKVDKEIKRRKQGKSYIYAAPKKRTSVSTRN